MDRFEIQIIMKAQLFIDSVNLCLSSLETAMVKLLTSSNPLPTKLQSSNIALASFKSNLLKSVSIFLAHASTGSSTGALTEAVKKIEPVIQQTSLKVQKLELCGLLKRKIHKMQRESMMTSISSSRVSQLNQSAIGETDDIKKLRKSVLLIEKDLGIADDENGEIHDSRVSEVVRRSFASLQMTPIRQYIDNSDTSMRLDDSYVIPELEKPNSELTEVTVERSKANVENESKLENTSLKAVKPKQKLKKPIKSNVLLTGKAGLFDNLLEESVQSCFAKTETSKIHKIYE